MESQPQIHFSPSSNRFPTDLLDSEVAKMSARLASVLLTPPRKRQNVEEDKKDFRTTSSPMAPMVMSVSEFQAVSQEQIEDKDQEKTQEVQEQQASKKVKCRYCDEGFAPESIRSHQDNCEKRTIDCEACGEKVELDIFDFHMEMCPARVDTYEAMLQAAQQQFLASLAAQNPEFNIQSEGELQTVEDEQAGNENNENGEDQDGQHEQEGDHDDQPYDDNVDDDDSGDFDPDAFTYEQLLTLDNTIVKKGLSADELKKIPVKVYLKNFDGPVSCSVCISDCESGEILRELPCTHKFHKDCVDTWLENNITCPVCKKYLR